MEMILRWVCVALYFINAGLYFSKKEHIIGIIWLVGGVCFLVSIALRSAA